MGGGGSGNVAVDTMICFSTVLRRGTKQYSLRTELGDCMHW